MDLTAASPTTYSPQRSPNSMSIHQEHTHSPRHCKVRFSKCGSEESWSISPDAWRLSTNFLKLAILSSETSTELSSMASALEHSTGVVITIYSDSSTASLEFGLSPSKAAQLLTEEQERSSN